MNTTVRTKWQDRHEATVTWAVATTSSESLRSAQVGLMLRINDMDKTDWQAYYACTQVMSARAYR